MATGRSGLMWVISDTKPRVYNLKKCLLAQYSNVMLRNSSLYFETGYSNEKMFLYRHDQSLCAAFQVSFF